MFTRVRERTCHSEMSQWKSQIQGMWVTSRTGSVGWDFWEKSVSWVLHRKKKVDFRLLADALWRVRTWFGADGKFSIERMCISLPYVEKPFNSKVIKSFVPELRSRKYFSCFGIPMLYMCVMDIMNILCTFHIFMYGYVTSSSSCRAGSTDIPDPLSPLLPIVHRPRQVFRTTSRILT